MKYRLVASIFVASALTSQAVVTAVSTDFDIAFTDIGNVPIPSGTGFIASGYFSGLADSLIASSSGSALTTAFKQFTNSSGVFGASGFPGFASFSSTAERVGAASPFKDQALYFVFANGSTLATSSQFAVFKASSLIFPDDSAAASDADLSVKLGGASPTAGTFIVGNTGGVAVIANQNIPTIQMAQIVPEPSALLLSAFGVLGLLRRKR